jgi:hypothetical protein
LPQQRHKRGTPRHSPKNERTRMSDPGLGGTYNVMGLLVLPWGRACSTSLGRRRPATSRAASLRRKCGFVFAGTDLRGAVLECGQTRAPRDLACTENREMP